MKKNQWKCPGNFLVLIIYVHFVWEANRTHIFFINIINKFFKLIWINSSNKSLFFITIFKQQNHFIFFKWPSKSWTDRGQSQPKLELELCLIQSSIVASNWLTVINQVLKHVPPVLLRWHFTCVSRILLWIRLFSLMK